MPAINPAEVWMTDFGMAAKVRRRSVVSGREQLIGTVGHVIEMADHEGWAQVLGETWKIRSTDKLESGQTVRVTGVQDLTLNVVPESFKEEGSRS